jgi:hypothetical protein
VMTAVFGSCFMVSGSCGKTERSAYFSGRIG